MTHEPREPAPGMYEETRWVIPLTPGLDRFAHVELRLTQHYVDKEASTLRVELIANHHLTVGALFVTFLGRP